MTGRCVIVSGGSRGLGAGIVERFLREGDRVATFSRSQTPQTDAWAQSHPDAFHFAPLDMTDRSAHRDFLAGVEERFGDVEVLVNNAGVAHTSLLALSDDEAVDRVIDLNLKGTISLTRRVARSMLPWGRGRIINISSIVGLSGYRGLSVYSATKAALDTLAEPRAVAAQEEARELGARGITVNSVAPGYLTTEMSESLGDRETLQIVSRTPLGRLGDPDDVAGTVCFLASDDAKFITGQTLVVDGGITC